MSPGFVDILALWDIHHLNRPQKVCVPLLVLVSDMLRHTPHLVAPEQGYVHSQLDGLAHSIIQQRLRSIYSHLSSGVRVRQNCALALCTAIASRSHKLARELICDFNFNLSALANLAIPPRLFTGFQSTTNRGSCAVVLADVDPLAIPTRHVFIYFVLSLLRTGDPTLLRHVLARKLLLGNVLRHLGSDPAPLVFCVLRTLLDRVLLSETHIPSRLQAALFSDAALEQIAAVNSSPPALPNTFSDEFYSRISALAHTVLLRVCTIPAHGLYITSFGLDSSPRTCTRRTKTSNVEQKREQEDIISISLGSLQSTTAGTLSGKRNAHIVDRTGAVEKGHATILRLLRKLRPIDSRRHSHLLLQILATRPQIAAGYLPYAAYPLEPRLSRVWFGAVCLLGSVTMTASPFSDAIRQSNNCRFEEADCRSFERFISPPSISKAAFNKGMNHSSGLVRYATLCLLLQTLHSVRTQSLRLEESMSESSITGMHFDESKDNSNVEARRLQRAALSLVPDPHVVLIVYESQKNLQNLEGFVCTSVLTRTHALNTLTEYARLIGAKGLADAKIDPIRLLPADPFNISTLELAAIINLLVVVYTSPRKCIYGNLVGVRSPSDTAEAVVAGSTNIRMRHENKEEVRGFMTRCHLKSLLSVAACAPVAGIRKGAALIATAHIESCGVLDSSTIINCEISAWLRHMPTAPFCATETVCTFLAEVISLASIQRHFDSSAAENLCVRIHDGSTTEFSATDFSMVYWNDITFDPSCLSQLAAGAITASAKIIKSSKRSRLQLLTVASYVSAVIFDIIQQQKDPVPLAAFVLYTYSHEKLEVFDLSEYPGLDSLVSFTKMIVSGFLSPRTCNLSMPEASQVSIIPSAPKRRLFSANFRYDRVSASAKALISRLQFASDDIKATEAEVFEELLATPRFILSAMLRESSRVYFSQIAQLALNAHGPLLPSPLIIADFLTRTVSREDVRSCFPTLIAVIGATFCTQLMKTNYNVTDHQANLDIAPIKEACQFAASGIPAHEISNLTRSLSFWCAFALSRLKRQNTDAKNTTMLLRRSERTFISLIDVYCAVLRRTEKLAICSPNESAMARKHLISSSALSAGFLHQGSLLTASLTDFVILYIESQCGTTVDSNCECFRRHFVAAAISVFDSRLSTKNGKKEMNEAMLFAVVPIFRHLEESTQRQLLEKVFFCRVNRCESARSLVQQTVTVEVAAAMLSYIPKLNCADGFKNTESKSPFLDAYNIILSLAASANNEIHERACELASNVLEKVDSPVARITRASTKIPDFSTLATAGSALRRGIGSLTAAGIRLAVALAAANFSHAALLIELTAAKLREIYIPGACTSHLLKLLPVCRVLLDIHSNTSCDHVHDFAHKNKKKNLQVCPTLDDMNLIAAAFYDCIMHGMHPTVGNFSIRSRIMMADTSMKALCISDAGTHHGAAFEFLPSIGHLHNTKVGAIIPLRGWWMSSSFANAIPASEWDWDEIDRGYPYILECATTARWVRCADLNNCTCQAYATCLISTLRTLMLVTPNRFTAGTSVTGTSCTIREAITEQSLIDDLGVILSKQMHLLPASAALVAAARAFARAALRFRLTSSNAICVLRKVIISLFSICTDSFAFSSELPHTAVLRSCAARSLVALVQDTFERTSSQYSVVYALLCHSSAYQLPRDIASICTPLASLLPVMCDVSREGNVEDTPGIVSFEDNNVENQRELPRYDIAYSSSESRGKDKVAGREYNDTDLCTDLCDVTFWSKAKCSAVSVIRFEVTMLLRALWSLHLTATSELETHCTLSGVEYESCPKVWRAEQATLIPLLAAAYGATLSLFDKNVGALLLQLNAAAGGKELSALGYLWGSAAKHFIRMRSSCELEREQMAFHDFNHKCMGENECAEMTTVSVVTASMQWSALLNARRCAATSVCFPYNRSLRLTPFPATGDPGHGYDLCVSGELKTRSEFPFIESERTPSYGYDPVWLLPFTLYGIRSRIFQLRECVDWGLLSLSFAATASAVLDVRILSYAILSTFSKACDAEGSVAPFRECPQVTAVLTAVRNTIQPLEPLKRLPTAIASLTAEAAAVALQPSFATYVPLQRVVLRRAALDTESLPISFLSLLHGCNGKITSSNMATARSETRALRVWMIRLLLAGLRESPEDARLFRKSFVIEVIMSHKSTVLATTDPYASQLALVLVARSVATSVMSHTLIETSSIIQWFSTIVLESSMIKCLDHKEMTVQRAAISAFATYTLTKLARRQGVIRGGPAGTATDFLSALRDIRVALSSLLTAFVNTHTHSAVNQVERTRKLTACGSLFVPALHMHSVIMQLLSRRRGEVIDISELAGLCAAVDSTGCLGTRRGTSLHEFMLDLIVGSTDTGRNGTFSVGAVSQQTVTTTAMSFVAVLRWAAHVSAQFGGKVAIEDATSKVLQWSLASLLGGGLVLMTAITATAEGGGAQLTANILGALLAASGPRHAAAIFAVVRTQGMLLQTLLRNGADNRLSEADRGVCLALQGPVFSRLVASGGALDELLSVVENCVFANLSRTYSSGCDATHCFGKLNTAQTVTDPRGELAARLAATLLRAAFAAASPDIFLQHVRAECGDCPRRGVDRALFRFRFHERDMFEIHGCAWGLVSTAHVSSNIDELTDNASELKDCSSHTKKRSRLVL
jgi:hypothetical protein